uniref:Uncharacterized protein n=1 Tax=Rhodopseudomonas palustris (strain BisA53) TaxID=316055 RepID=Q07U73_RHOP5
MGLSCWRSVVSRAAATAYSVSSQLRAGIAVLVDRYLPRGAPIESKWPGSTRPLLQLRLHRHPDRRRHHDRRGAVHPIARAAVAMPRDAGVTARPLK